MTSHSEPPAGIDPATSFLPRTRSTTELRGQQVNTLHRFLRFAKSVGNLLLRSQYSYSRPEWAARSCCLPGGFQHPGSRPGIQLPGTGAVPGRLGGSGVAQVPLGQGFWSGKRCQRSEVPSGVIRCLATGDDPRDSILRVMANPRLTARSTLVSIVTRALFVPPFVPGVVSKRINSH